MELTDAKPIEITDKALFDSYLKNHPPNISELTFTNLFIWQNYYQFLFKEWKDHILVFSKEFFKNWNKSATNNVNNYFFLPPIGSNPEGIILELFNDVSELEIHRVPQEIILNLENQEDFSTSNLTIMEDRNNWDYVYEIESLINLPGNKFRQKRRWLAKFFEQYNYDFKIISGDLINKTLQLQLEWCDQNECQGNEDLEQEQKAIERALEHYYQLGISGGIIFVNDKCVAYTLGELLNDDTLVVHIEKAHVEIEGAYQAINNLFLKEFGPNFTYINREQDLGLPGLRRAKEGYKPIRMTEKSIICRTNEIQGLDS